MSQSRENLQTDRRTEEGRMEGQMEGQMDRRTDGGMDEQNLFYRTLLPEAGGPIKVMCSYG